MQCRQKVGLTIALACLFGAALVADAAASLFLAEPPGKLLVKAAGEQVFTFQTMGVTCAGVSVVEPSESLVALRALSLRLTVKYENCKDGAAPVEITTVKWLYSADGGLVTLLNNVNVSFTSCTITLLSSKNQGLREVHYLSGFTEVQIDYGISNLNFEGCGFKSESNGKISRFMLVTLEGGGTLKWAQQG